MLNPTTVSYPYVTSSSCLGETLEQSPRIDHHQHFDTPDAFRLSIEYIYCKDPAGKLHTTHTISNLCPRIIITSSNSSATMQLSSFTSLLAIAATSLCLLKTASAAASPTNIAERAPAPTAFAEPTVVSIEGSYAELLAHMDKNKLDRRQQQGRLLMCDRKFSHTLPTHIL